MTTLLIRLQAPMQSWGISSHFTNRGTGREPSKSGVIGLICAALGRPRNTDLSDINNLRMGVRVDREGILQKDFQIAQDVFLAAGKGTKDSEISDRYYLADAAFVVGFEGSQELLKEIHQALKAPHWALYLGRKAFPPGKPVWLKNGLLDETLLEALKQFPSIVKDETKDVRLIIESENGEFVRTDIPINFKDRKFSSRRVHITRVERPPYEEV